MRFFKVIFFIILCVSCVDYSNISFIQDYPITYKQPTIDNYFGHKITDDYRHLENLKDTSVVNWFKVQDDFTEKCLEKNTNQKKLADQIRKIYKDKNKTITDIKYSDNGFAFYLKQNVNESVRKLYYKSTSNTDAVELFDPSNFQKELKREYTINYIQPSWNAAFVLVSLSYDGVKGSNLIIIDVINNKVLPENITNAEPNYYLGVSWLPDSSGFLYLYIPTLDPEDENYMINSSTVLYRLGEDPNNRHIIFSSSSNIQISNEDMPIAKILSKNDKYIIGYKASVENYWEAYYTEIEELEKETINWKPFYSLDEKIYADYGYFIDDEFVFISGKNADKRTISSFNMEQSFKAKILVEEKKDEVITSLFIANNNLYYTTSKFGVEAFLWEYKNGQEYKIDLPSPSGEISLYSPSNEHSTLYIGLDGWTQDYMQYVFKDNSFNIEPISSNEKQIKFDDIEVKETFVISHDGTEVPISIVYKKDLKLDGTNPSFIYTYGAYGESLTPFFSPIFLSWVRNGGVFAIPHIRGGGEKGDSWHEQGMKSTKFNSWKDIIACTEYLIKKNYTSKEKTVVYSSSAGGISIGMAIVERPDLFDVFIADVPMLNPLRSEERANNATNYLEYGSVKDSIECMGLIKMDPYVNLKPNTDYPATLIISGFNDARIDPWIPGKFVAKLQFYSTSNNPVLLDVIYDAGHEGGDTDEEFITLYSKIFAFAFWQTNHKIN